MTVGGGQLFFLNRTQKAPIMKENFDRLDYIRTNFCSSEIPLRHMNSSWL